MWVWAARRKGWQAAAAPGCAGRLISPEGVSGDSVLPHLYDVLPPPRRLEATYFVPSLPPPKVRLAAIAWDHVDLQDDIEMLEFPTGFNDVWRDEQAGKEVRIVQSGDVVTATYLEQRPCDHRDQAGTQTFTRFDFSGKIQGTKINGEIEVCRFGDESAGWVRTALELTVAQNLDELSGSWHDFLGGARVPIRFTRQPFPLGRPIDVEED